ncbi:MAG: hypothetical protein EG825_12890 [Rhodocyclaceae bacterium]|nr:hypothetical protein [Rhodocyclaceae bacterium]
MTFRHALALLLFAFSCASIQAGDAKTLVAELRKEFQPGLPLARAQELLKARNTTYSLRSAAECEALVKEARTAVNLAPRGGPCIFGKIPVSRTWYGARSDVILQLVFTADGRMVDGNFEAIETFL